MDLLVALWEQVGVKDLIDIILVSLLLYQFLRIVQGTKAVQVLIGVVLLGILFWIGISNNLHSVNWLLAHFFDSFFIIVVILFQDQIRSALATFGGKGKIFGGISRDRLEVEINEVVEACLALKSGKVGALVVFERTNGLSNYIETGTKLSSKIHSDLIYALFQSRGPLHDGAIIVSKGMIEAAGCFLPLSKNVEIDRHLGTRHRAALGVTEVTDAVVVIVSEETGNITLCLDGEFHPCPTGEHLRVFLKHLWVHNGLMKNALAEMNQGSLST